MPFVSTSHKNHVKFLTKQYNFTKLNILKHGWNPCETWVSACSKNSLKVVTNKDLCRTWFVLYNTVKGLREMLIPSQIWGEDVHIDRAKVRANLEEIQKNIAHSKIKIIAVTKYFGLDSIKAGFEVGIRDFGESRAIDAINKIEALPEEIKQNSTFHFIGHLQTNKVEKVVKHFDVIHSVDSLKVARAISNAACQLNKREKVLLQVNNAEEEQKFGYAKDVLKADMQELLKLKGLEIIGLMNIAPLNLNDSELEGLFKDIRMFRDELEREFDIKLPELSMGMSNDYKIAIREGATIIRVGRKLFS